MTDTDTVFRLLDDSAFRCKTCGECGKPKVSQHDRLLLLIHDIDLGRCECPKDAHVWRERL